jgi:hypothetical protein
MSNSGDSSNSTSVKYSDLPALVAVELPFFATSVGSAYSALGGETFTKDVICNEAKNIQVKFPTEDAIRSYLVGENTEKGTSLLVKIRRRKQNASVQPNGRSNIDFKTEIIGRVSNSYVFETPADFQV